MEHFTQDWLVSAHLNSISRLEKNKTLSAKIKKKETLFIFLLFHKNQADAFSFPGAWLPAYSQVQWQWWSRRLSERLHKKRSAEWDAQTHHSVSWRQRAPRDAAAKLIVSSTATKSTPWQNWSALACIIPFHSLSPWHHLFPLLTRLLSLSSSARQRWPVATHNTPPPLAVKHDREDWGPFASSL